MNLFAGGGKKRNPLAALMQPNLMESLQPQDQTQAGQLPQQPMPPQQPMQGIPGPQGEAALPNGMPQSQTQKTPYELKPADAFYLNPFTIVPKALWDLSGPHMSLDERKQDLQKTLSPLNMSLPGGQQAPQDKSAQPKNQLDFGPTLDQLGATPGGTNDIPQEQKEKSLDLGMGGGLFGPAMQATQDIVQKYGKAAQTMQGAKNALRAEFQNTPELDQIISKTESELAQKRMDRKQPGVGEFIAMALMNLSGMHPRDSADMVLGLNNQKNDETRLEDRLAQLEGGRASAKMSGRHELRGMERQDRYQQLQNSIHQQESQRKQSNLDRDFGLKQQGQSSGLLRALAGQEAQVMQGMNADAVKKAGTSRDKLKKLLGLDDAGLERMLQQQKAQQAPQDERQSRMFGDLMTGGGYA